MRPSYNLNDGPRGLYCPDCGDRLDGRLIAQTYPSTSGVYRRRVCRACHSDVETVEVVLGREVEIMDVSGLDQHQRAILASACAGMRLNNQGAK